MTRLCKLSCLGYGLKSRHRYTKNANVAGIAVPMWVRMLSIQGYASAVWKMWWGRGKCASLRRKNKRFDAEAQRRREKIRNDLSSRNLLLLNELASLVTLNIREPGLKKQKIKNNFLNVFCFSLRLCISASSFFLCLKDVSQ
jgi:hypothetical protein